MLKRIKVNDHEAVLVLLTAALFCLVLALPSLSAAETCTIDTVAGGYLGDGGNAAAAVVSGPTGMARDGAGNLYIAETDHHRVRKVDVNGVITTLAGTGLQGCKGNGGAAASSAAILASSFLKTAPILAPITSGPPAAGGTAAQRSGEGGLTGRGPSGGGHLLS